MIASFHLFHSRVTVPFLCFLRLHLNQTLPAPHGLRPFAPIFQPCRFYFSTHTLPRQWYVTWDRALTRDSGCGWPRYVDGAQRCLDHPPAPSTNMTSHVNNRPAWPSCRRHSKLRGSSSVHFVSMDTSYCIAAVGNQISRRDLFAFEFAAPAR
ncbi:hypothetical protein IWZ03DRAFT_16074 [Phyllosticta citriasiana]|uniref:Secreted protein n=1 Tax=Phyllosticta citriasiana TaxID=595635 RepID=A0ABR1KYR7_9PEZI